MLQGQGGVNKVTLLAAYNAFAKYADCHEPGPDIGISCHIADIEPT